MLKNISKLFVIIAGSVSLVIAVLFFATEISTIYKWTCSGVINTNFDWKDDSTLVFTRVDTTDFITSPFPDSGDVVLAMDDAAASIDYIRENIYKGYPPGKELILSYTHGEDTLKTTVKTNAIDRTDIAPNLAISFLRFLIVLCYFAVGFWAFLKRPDSRAIHSLALFCFAMADLMTGTVNIGFDNIIGIEVPYFDKLMDIIRAIALFFGAFWLNLQLLFPKTNKYMARYPVLIYLICYLPLLLFKITADIFSLSFEGEVVIVIIMLQVVIGFLILTSNHRKAAGLLEKRQTRLVLWGSGVGLFGLVVFALIALFFSSWLIGLGSYFILGFIVCIFLGLLLSPLSFAYAFGKYRLLEVEGKIRRGTRYLAVTVVLLVVFYFMIYGISELVLTSIGIESRAPTLLVALLLALGFSPAQRKVQTLAERQIYPERNRLRTMLRDFLSQAVSYTDKNLFWTELESHLKDVLKVDAVCPVLYFEKENKFSHWKKDIATPFLTDSKFIESLGTLVSCPLMLDEALASKKIFLTDDENKWLQQNNIAMILPLVTRSRLVGFIGLGYKAGREDFRAEDCSILMSIASQVAMAGENIMLIEENVEKRRLETQLGIARKVQEGLLPEKLPDTPGLQVAGKSRSCLEVAGDYYDVVNIGNNHTVLAIGDVSGKGAGAALLMSNLQASFRTAIEIDTGLAKMMARVNNLIHRNTKPDQFITFFVGVYDNANSTFAYVNAGHNPPFVLHQNGQIEYLDEGGLILGALPGMPYEQGTINLESGDLILLYTDGVSEAENAADDMFGENRLETFLKANVQLPVDDILRKLESEVEQFTEGIPLTDDFTALVARVVK